MPIGNRATRPTAPKQIIDRKGRAVPPTIIRGGQILYVTCRPGEGG